MDSKQLASSFHAGSRVVEDQRQPAQDRFEEDLNWDLEGAEASHSQAFCSEGRGQEETRQAHEDSMVASHVGKSSLLVSSKLFIYASGDPGGSKNDQILLTPTSLDY